MRARRLALPLCAVAVAACSGQRAPTPTLAPLGGDVARVAETSIPTSLVGQVAGARGVSARTALDGLVEDALAAEGARARGLDHTPDVEWASAVALARTVAERLRDEARAEGPPTVDELAYLSVVHAVVLRSASVRPAQAIALAQAIAGAVSSARTPEEFESNARAASGTAIRVSVERLPAFDAAGRASDGSGFDPVFVAAAFGLRAPGQTSGIVETPFGWHVIRLVSRDPPPPSQLDERRQDLADAVVALRARMVRDSLVRARRQRAPVEVSGAADQLLAEAVAGPP